jgi:restriction endonuclease Mrr
MDYIKTQKKHKKIIKITKKSQKSHKKITKTFLHQFPCKKNTKKSQKSHKKVKKTQKSHKKNTKKITKIQKSYKKVTKKLQKSFYMEFRGKIYIFTIKINARKKHIIFF